MKILFTKDSNIIVKFKSWRTLSMSVLLELMNSPHKSKIMFKSWYSIKDYEEFINFSQKLNSLKNKNWEYELNALIK